MREPFVEVDVSRLANTAWAASPCNVIAGPVFFTMKTKVAVFGSAYQKFGSEGNGKPASPPLYRKRPETWCVVTSVVSSRGSCPMGTTVPSFVEATDIVIE